LNAFDDFVLRLDCRRFRRLMATGGQLRGGVGEIGLR
jgi:hypothetical protein